MDTPLDLPPTSTRQPQVHEQLSPSSVRPVQEQSSGQPGVQTQTSPPGQPGVQEQTSPLGQHGVQELQESGGSTDSTNPQAPTTETHKPLLEGSSPPRGHNEPYEPHTPTRSRIGHMMHGPSRRTAIGHTSVHDSGIGWIVPVEEKPHRLTIGERLDPTIVSAEEERVQYAAKECRAPANVSDNVPFESAMDRLHVEHCDRLQVLLGALTTGLGASLSGKQVSIATAILGGFSTIVASYLARARGSNEPELSIARVKDLDTFLRDSLAFKMDYGHQYGTPENGLDERLENLRRRFEELLGNADGQRKLAPPV